MATFDWQQNRTGAPCSPHDAKHASDVCIALCVIPWSGAQGCGGLSRKSFMARRTTASLEWKT